MEIPAINREVFRHAKPFPHVVIDGFIDADTVRAINAEWPEQRWNNYRHAHSLKRSCPYAECFGLRTRALIAALNQAAFVSSLGKLSGITGLSADISLAESGLDESFAGGFLGIHADFNIHPETRLYRRLNLLLYLNEDWQEEWGGHLELWDREKTGCQVKIAPVAGRCVVFATTDSSFHGHPKPLACPPERSRRSIALYYYSPEPAEAMPREHSTLYLGEEEKWFPSTVS